MTITPNDLVALEVIYCVSSLVSTLAGGYGAIENSSRTYERGQHAAADLSALTEQAMELCSPIPDYEEAAIQAGWKQIEGRWGKPDAQFGEEDMEWADSAEEVCDDHEGIEPYEREVFEHWIVSDWLADKLEAKGEKVDKDFAGMTVWARTTTGQAIYADHVIEQITADLNTERGE